MVTETTFTDVKGFDEAHRESGAYGRSLAEYERFVGPLEPFVKRASHVFPGERLRILDLGVGQGVAAGQMAAEASSSGYDITIAGLSLTLCPTRLSNYVLGKANELPFASESLHGVISVNTWQYLEDEVMAVWEVMRVLKEGGEFRLSLTPCPKGRCVIQTGNEKHVLEVNKRTSLLKYDPETGMPSWKPTLKNIGKRLGGIQPQIVFLEGENFYLSFLKPISHRGKKQS